MQKRQTRFRIDARGETLDPLKTAEVTYCINDLAGEETQLLLREAVHPLVKEVIVLDKTANKVKIVYNPDFISTGFIDYLLAQKGLVFTKGG